jgi:hypothetical protein
MAGKTDERTRVAISRPQVAHRSAVETLALKARCRQTRRDHVQRSIGGGRDRAARDQRFGELQRVALDVVHERSSSLMDVLARVCASTRLTITAQVSEYLPSGEGRLPGTTTDPAGTLP